jgi:class 3 adenylate cyclase
MGLHWGRDGSVVMRQHSITKHKMYGGPAVHTTMDVSEAANGGQVLLTDVSRANGTLCMIPINFCHRVHQRDPDTYRPCTGSSWVVLACAALGSVLAWAAFWFVVTCPAGTMVS